MYKEKILGMHNNNHFLTYSPLNFTTNLTDIYIYIYI